MAVPTASIFDTNANRIQEVLSKTIDMFLAEADPVWRDTMFSSAGVSGSDVLGRGMEIIKFFQYAMGGVIESGRPRGDWTTYGDATDTKYGQASDMVFRSATQTFPDANDDISGVPNKLRIPMWSILTNFKQTLGEKQAEALKATVGEITAPRLVAFSRNVARRLCSSWYVNQASNYRLCGLGASTGTDAYTVDGTNKRITFYPDNKAIARLAKGDRLDLIRSISSVLVRMNDTAVTAGGVVSGDGAGQSFSTRIRCVVDTVDKIRGTVVLQFDPSISSSKFTTTGSLATGQLGSDTFIVQANSNTAGGAISEFPGLNSWMKFGGSGANNKYLLGSEALGTVGNGIIDVDVFPQFKSFLKAVNGVLTEHKLNLYLDRVTEAYEDEGDFIDTLVTTQGVIRSMAGQKYAREILDRTGRLTSLKNEGEDGAGMVHHHDGRMYELHTSRWMEYQTLIGYRRKGNWVKYVPPKTPNSSMGGGMEAGIPFEFLVPSITGLNTTRWPMLNNGLLTEASQMPGHLRMVLAPVTQVRGLKLTGITEERIYGDNAP